MNSLGSASGERGTVHVSAPSVLTSTTSISSGHQKSPFAIQELLGLNPVETSTTSQPPVSPTYTPTYSPLISQSQCFAGSGGFDPRSMYFSSPAFFNSMSMAGMNAINSLQHPGMQVPSMPPLGFDALRAQSNNNGK